MSKLNQEELLKLLGMAVQNAIEYFVINKDKEFIAKIPKLQQAHLQIRELIKILFAKEISAGPIKKDISQPDLIEWLQGINQAATAVKDYYVMKATTQLIEMIQKPGVTEKFVDKMVEESVYVLHQDKYVFFERKLREAGVEVLQK